MNYKAVGNEACKKKRRQIKVIIIITINIIIVKESAKRGNAVANTQCRCDDLVLSNAVGK